MLTGCPPRLCIKHLFRRQKKKEGRWEIKTTKEKFMVEKRTTSSSAFYSSSFFGTSLCLSLSLPFLFFYHFIFHLQIDFRPFSKLTPILTSSLPSYFRDIWTF